jgi:hypothetical protein
MVKKSLIVVALLAVPWSASAQYAPGNYSTTAYIAGSITSGGTAQAVAFTLPAAKIRCVQNPKSATEDLFVAFGATASPTIGQDLQAGVQVCWPWSGNVSVYAATTSHAFVAFEAQ